MRESRPGSGDPQGAKFGSRLRRALLTVHIVIAVAWIGVDLCVLVLAIVGSASGSATTQQSAFVVLGPIADLLLLPLPVLALVTGVAVASGTHWKLLRHYWVVVSLALTTIAAAAVVFALRPRMESASSRARAAGIDPASAVGMLRQQIIVASSVALVVLVAVATINVYKPWGRISSGRSAPRLSKEQS